MKKLYFLITAFFATVMAGAQCTVPELSSVAGPGESLCSAQTATLTATSNGDQIVWFDAAVGGNVLGTGDTFDTATLSATTSFWAEAQNIAVGAPIAGGGKVAPSSSGGTTVVATTSPWGLAFSATQDFVLNSVDVFLSSATAGTVTVQLKDANYNLLETVQVQAPAGGSSSAPVQFTIPLGFMIEGGQSYKLVVPSGGPAMIRDLSSNGFPYPIGTVGTIDSGTINNANTNPNVYYFLYNWNFSPVEVCSSDRQEVTVEVINTPAPQGNASQTFAEGATLADLDVVGEDLMWFADAAGTQPLSPDTVLVDGTVYYVQQTLDGCPGAMLAITATQQLGVGSQAMPNLMAYPNPVSGHLTVSNSHAMESVAIYNLQGQLIRAVVPGAADVQLDFSGLRSGLYLVKVTSADKSATLPIVRR